jgi:membrane-associated phospholipid phosphatase
MTLDVALFHFFNNFARHSLLTDALIIFFATYVPYLLGVAFILTLYFSGYTKRIKLHLGITAATSILGAYVGTQAIRFFYHRPRPFLDLITHKLISIDQWSFPSMHSAFFFALASALFLFNKKWGAWFFVGATLVAIARVVAGVHYPSDILAGMGLGMLVSCGTLFFLKKEKRRWY